MKKTVKQLLKEWNLGIENINEALERNIRMQDFLSNNGIEARVKYIDSGSLRGCWRLYNPSIKWSDELVEKLNSLGFVGFDNQPLGKYSGNGGLFSTFVIGHKELL